jgi:hypothetical protein
MDLRHGNDMGEPAIDDPKAIRQSGPYFVRAVADEMLKVLEDLYIGFIRHRRTPIPMMRYWPLARDAGWATVRRRMTRTPGKEARMNLTPDQHCAVCGWNNTSPEQRRLKALIDHVQTVHAPTHPCPYCLEQQYPASNPERPWAVEPCVVRDGQLLTEPAFYCTTCGWYRCEVLKPEHGLLP